MTDSKLPPALTPTEARAIVAIGTLAAMADGSHDPDERAQLNTAARALGLDDAESVIARATAGELSPASLAADLSSPASRQLAYDTAVAICQANGWRNPSESAFLRELAVTLGADTAPAARAAAGLEAVNTRTEKEQEDHATSGPAAPSVLDQHILDQAILTAALELLPDRLANLGILPLQLRLVQRVGQHHGQTLDASQVKDLAAALGIGAAAQVLEKVVRRSLGGLAGGLLGGALGGMLGGTAGQAAGVASGMAVTFAATYALGHAADQYYAQGRQLSTADLKALFTRFTDEAQTIFPRVEQRIRDLARSNQLSHLVRTI
ncbi:MAG: GTPase [Gemmatimonas sp.]|nr:GTPase [Gemmatimonas sp.]